MFGRAPLTKPGHSLTPLPIESEEAASALKSSYRLSRPPLHSVHSNRPLTISLSLPDTMSSTMTSKEISPPSPGR